MSDTGKESPPASGAVREPAVAGVYLGRRVALLTQHGK